MGDKRNYTIAAHSKNISLMLLYLYKLPLNKAMIVLKSKFVYYITPNKKKDWRFVVRVE